MMAVKIRVCPVLGVTQRHELFLSGSSRSANNEAGKWRDADATLSSGVYFDYRYLYNYYKHRLSLQHVANIIRHLVNLRLVKLLNIFQQSHVFIPHKVYSNTLAPKPA
jgi:hypothetical protein